MPKVSICIPTFNYAQYIPETIESVLAQSYQDFEVIIIDDCSTDNTAEIVGRYADRDRRIQFYRNRRNLGMVANWNLCLEKTSGTYVKIMGADDILEPSCIEKSMRVLEENPGVTLLSCARLLIDERSQPFKIESYADSFQIAPGAAVIRKCFFDRNLIGEPAAVMFRRKDAVRGFNPRYRQLTDIEMWFQLLEKGDFACIPEPLCRFRVHSTQMSKANMQSLVFIEDELRLKQDFFGKGPIAASFMNDLRWKFKLCYTIWTHKFIGLDIRTIRARVKEYLPLPVFYPLAYTKIVKDKLIEVARNMTRPRSERNLIAG
jgi:glycosyltransferase involved in cell wall biosynthesis